MPPGWILPAAGEARVHFVEPYKDGTAKTDDGNAHSDENESNTESGKLSEPTRYPVGKGANWIEIVELK